MKTNSAQQQLWVLASLTMISTIGIALPYPIFAPLLLHPTHLTLIPADWSAHSRAIIFGALLAVYPLGVFLGSPVLGGLSDQYGRRKLIICSLALTTLGYMMTIVSLHFNSISLLLLSRFFTGFTESNIAILRSAVADISEINRHQGFGLINGAATMGYVIGPLLGGVFSDSNLASWFNLSTPFYLSGLMVLVGMITASITLQKKQQVLLKDEQTLTLKQRFNLLKQLKKLSQNNTLKLLFITSFCFFFAVDTFYEFFPAYLVKKANMLSIDIAIITAILSAGLAVGSIWLSRFYSQRFAIIPTILLHIALYAITLICILLSSSTLLFYITFALAGLFISIASNHLYVHISKNTKSSQQGITLGMATSLRMLGDATISFIGGFMIIISTNIPIIIAVMMACAAMLVLKVSHITRPVTAISNKPLS